MSQLERAFGHRKVYVRHRQLRHVKSLGDHRVGRRSNQFDDSLTSELVVHKDRFVAAEHKKAILVQDLVNCSLLRLVKNCLHVAIQLVSFVEAEQSATRCANIDQKVLRRQLIN